MGFQLDTSTLITTIYTTNGSILDPTVGRYVVSVYVKIQLRERKRSGTSGVSKGVTCPVPQCGHGHNERSVSKRRVAKSLGNDHLIDRSLANDRSRPYGRSLSIVGVTPKNQDQWPMAIKTQERFLKTHSLASHDSSRVVKKDRSLVLVVMP